MLVRQSVLTIAFVLVAAACSLKMMSTSAQLSSQRRAINPNIPSELQPSLDEGLRRFIEAQANGQWDEVARLLGRFRGNSRRGFLYTPAHKECLLSQMRAAPMISFVKERVMFSTAILSEPTERRWWILEGMAEFKTASGSAKSRILMTAYRDQNEWYFTPPSDDPGWEREHVTEADLARDLSSNVSID